MTSRTPCLAGLRPLSCSCLLTIWVAPKNRLAKLRTPRTYCFNAGFSGAPNGVRLQSGRAASGTAHNPGSTQPAKAIRNILPMTFALWSNRLEGHFASFTVKTWIYNKDDPEMKAHTPHLSMTFSFTLTLLMLFSVAQAQQKKVEKPQLPTTPKIPTVNCSEAQTSKACSSFKQLLEAKDEELLDSLSSPTSYVCFRPNEDAFLIFHVNAPTDNRWEKLGGGKEQQASWQVLGQFRNGVLYHNATVFGDWHRYSSGKEATEPLFMSLSDKESNEGATVNIDAVELSIEYPFKNQNSGTTQYSLTIRRSTGRFTETFAVDNVSVSENSGTCVIYR